MFLKHFHSPCLYKYSYNGQLQPVQMGHQDYQQLDLIKVKSSIKLEYVEKNRGLYLVQFGVNIFFGESTTGTALFRYLKAK